jgi:hypothetical protein
VRITSQAGSVIAPSAITRKIRLGFVMMKREIAACNDQP